MTTENQTEEIEEKPVPSGIGGWLILPAIGLVLAPILWTLGLIVMAFAIPEYPIIIPLNMVLGILLLGLLIWTAIQFFRKKKNAPKLMIACLIAKPAMTAILFAVATILKDYEFAADYRGELVQVLIISAIWGRYFNVSKRVKATFIN